MIVKAGTVLILTSGEYSDYGFQGPFHVRRDFDPVEVATVFRAQWRNPNPDRRWVTKPTTDEFIAWFCKEGFIEDVENTLSWHLGDYEFKPDVIMQEGTSG